LHEQSKKHNRPLAERGRLGAVKKYPRISVEAEWAKLKDCHHR
jgi:hypothetical protein